MLYSKISSSTMRLKKIFPGLYPRTHVKRGGYGREGREREELGRGGARKRKGERKAGDGRRGGGKGRGREGKRYFVLETPTGTKTFTNRTLIRI
jgi:hypothetical protein